MLYLVAPVGWLLLVTIGLALCRVGAKAERMQQVGLEDLFAAGYTIRDGLLLREPAALDFRSQRPRRATG